MTPHGFFRVNVTSTSQGLATLIGTSNVPGMVQYISLTPVSNADIRLAMNTPADGNSYAVSAAMGFPVDPPGVSGLQLYCAAGGQLDVALYSQLAKGG
jgi:hypothetical protein